MKADVRDASTMHTAPLYSLGVIQPLCTVNRKMRFSSTPARTPSAEATKDLSKTMQTCIVPSKPSVGLQNVSTMAFASTMASDLELAPFFLCPPVTRSSSTEAVEQVASSSCEILGWPWHDDCPNVVLRRFQCIERALSKKWDRGKCTVDPKA